MLESLNDVYNLHDLKTLAEAQLERGALEYYSSGAMDGHTLSESTTVFSRLKLRPRVLCDVSSVDTRTTLLGLDLSSPLCAAPTAFHRMAHDEGERATARAIRQFGTLMTLSTLSNTDMEEVGLEAQGRWWFQLYVFRDRELTRSLVARAEQAGARALVLTVDTPRLGRREINVRNLFRLPPHLSIKNAGMQGWMPPASQGGDGLAEFVAAQMDASLSWKDLEWLRSITHLPIVLKGILTAEDAKLTLEHGANAIWVSTHGGRQVDTAVSTLEALPEIVEAVNGQLEVYLDGGIRRGSDVLKVLALGARAVFLGRPVLWGLACGGEAGVSKMLNMLQYELELTMALCGKNSLEGLKPDLIFRG